MNDTIAKTIADDQRAAAIAATLGTCAYDQVRDRMIDIEIIYGGRPHVPPALAREIGQRLRRRPDYYKLAAWNGLDPATCKAQGYGPRQVPSLLDPKRVVHEIATTFERWKQQWGGQ